MTIKFICENNHYDPLTQIAGNRIVNQAVKHNIVTAIYESNAMEVDADAGIQQSTVAPTESDMAAVEGVDFDINVCISGTSEILHKLQNFPAAYYIDEKSLITNWRNEFNWCNKLNDLNTQPESKIVGILMKHIVEDDEEPEEKTRDEVIVQNLIGVIHEIGSKDAIGQLGDAHCEDLNRHLTKHHSDLLEQVHFFSMHSVCTKENMQSLIFNYILYPFGNCYEEASRSRFMKVIVKHEAIIMDFHHAHPDQDSVEFKASPHTTTLYVSTIGAENSVTPLEAAEIFYNHTKW